jgi:deaminated glutathione amidase
VRAAAVQLNSTDDHDRNLEVAERLVRAAAGDGAELIVLPEKWTVLGTPEAIRAAAEPLGGPSLSAAAGWARELGVFLVAGSVAELVPDRKKLANTSVMFDPNGNRLATYRKIHMFDVDVGDVSYRESEVEQAGDGIELANANGIQVGLTICYDLRFPELYRILALRGARVITVPANFTRITGEAHWEVLLRARAIENQVFVIAPGQGRRPGPEGDSYGNSMIVDPWGEVLARAPMEGDCFIAADLDLARQDEVREKLPSLANRVGAAYKWPQEVTA